MTFWSRRFRHGALTLAVLVAGGVHAARGNESSELIEEEDAVVFVPGEFSASVDPTMARRIDSFLGESGGPNQPGPVIPTLARMRHRKQAEQPGIAPTVEQAAATPASAASTQLSSVFSASQASIVNQLSSARQSEGAGPASDFVLGIEASVFSSTDSGNLISKSNAILGVASEQRTPIVTYNLSRGRHVGQQSGNGSYWFPARQDLDTLMSKIDSRIVENFLVIQGPYSARYGPGFAFYDVELLHSPRYDGYETHGVSSLDWKENGDQWYGRQTVMAGSNNWGVRIGYGDRSGNDYRTGDGTEMPSSYNSRDWDVAIGYDLSPYQSVEFNYLRLDQTDVEFPGQMFDMDFLVTDAYEIEYVNDCACFADRVELEGWYNRTRFEGDNLRAGKRRQLPQLDDFFAPGVALNSFTDVNASSAGYRFESSWGCEQCGEVSVGTDFRYLTQELNEFAFAVPPVGGPISLGNTPIPNSYSSNPGIFMEANRQLTECLTIKTGGRLDWVAMNADPTASGDLESIGPDFDQSFDLYSSFLSAERRLGCHWTGSVGGGYAMRPPTMTEMYADGPFVAVFPQFVLTSVFGNPGLAPERMWQVDAGLTAEYSRFRGGIRGYHSWIRDYITYDLVNPLGGAPTFNAVNTELATLFGAEVHGEYDLNRCWTTFATLSYIEGTDHRRNDTVGQIREALLPNPNRSESTLAKEALPVIPPINSRVGIRRHDPCPDQRWSIEFAAQIVNNQDRVATTLRETSTPGYTIYDLRAYWQASDSMLLTMGVENIFDKFYQQHFDPRVFSTVFQPGTVFYTGVQLTY